MAFTGATLGSVVNVSMAYAAASDDRYADDQFMDPIFVSAIGDGANTVTIATAAVSGSVSGKYKLNLSR